MYERGDENGDGAEADVIVTRIYEQGELETLARQLVEFGVDLSTWSVEDPPGPARYRLFVGKRRDDNEPLELDSLLSVLEAIRRAGQKGVDVQRYKGLGEMNYDQLWETTMDPQRRTLLRVQLNDAAEADRLFSLLMGESVEPRREFIERHALEVTELDV